MSEGARVTRLPSPGGLQAMTLLPLNARFRRDPVLSEGISVTLMPSSGGAQRTTVLPLKMLNGFLFGISAAVRV